MKALTAFWRHLAIRKHQTLKWLRFGWLFAVVILLAEAGLQVLNYPVTVSVPPAAARLTGDGDMEFKVPLTIRLFGAVPDTSGSSVSQLKVRINGRELKPHMVHADLWRGKVGFSYYSSPDWLRFSIGPGSTPDDVKSISLENPLRLPPMLVYFALICALVLPPFLFWGFRYGEFSANDSIASHLRARWQFRSLYLFPLSLMGIYASSVIYYLDDPCEQITKITPIVSEMYIHEDKYRQIFGDSISDISAALKWNGNVPIFAPWWVARIRDGQSIQLAPPQVYFAGRHSTYSSPFVDVFGREIGAREPGVLAIGTSKSKIRPSSGGSWQRIYLSPGRSTGSDPLMVRYIARTPGAEFEIWGTFLDMRYPKDLPAAVVNPNGEKAQLVYGMAPPHGGFVDEADFQQLAHFEDVPDKVFITRAGYERCRYGSKALGIALLLLSLAVGACAAMFSLASNRGYWLPRLGVALIVLAIPAAVFWNAAEYAQSTMENYVSSAEARKLLNADDVDRGKFIRSKFHITQKMKDDSLGTVVSNVDTPEAFKKAMGTHKYYMLGRLLGQNGVMSDDAGYFVTGWRIMSDDRYPYFYPPIGFSIPIAIVSQFTGVATKNVIYFERFMYIAIAIIIFITGASMTTQWTGPLLAAVLWLLYPGAAEYSQIVYSELPAMFMMALIALAVFSAPSIISRHGPAAHWPMLLSLAFILAIATYVRDIFVVAAPFIGLLYVLITRMSLAQSIRAGAVVVAVIVLSWVPIRLLHNNSSLEIGIVSLMPIAPSHLTVLTTTDNSDVQKSADFSISSKAPPSPGVSISEWPRKVTRVTGELLNKARLIWVHHAWIPFQGMPFAGHYYQNVGNFVHSIIYIGFGVALGLALVLRDLDCRNWRTVRRALLLSALFLFVITCLHVIFLDWATSRMRAVLEPLVVLGAGVGIMAAAQRLLRMLRMEGKRRAG